MIRMNRVRCFLSTVMWLARSRLHRKCWLPPASNGFRSSCRPPNQSVGSLHVVSQQCGFGPKFVQAGAEFLRRRSGPRDVFRADDSGRSAIYRCDGGGSLRRNEVTAALHCRMAGADSVIERCRRIAGDTCWCWIDTGYVHIPS